MKTELDQTTLGIIVDFRLLGEVLKTMNIGGKKWWIDSDVEEAAITGSVRVYHGYPGCVDFLNSLCFEAPVLKIEGSNGTPDKLLVLIEYTQWVSEEPGYDIERGRIIVDSVDDLISSFYPIQSALIARLQAGNSTRRREL